VREAVLGDLAEGFAARVAEHGPAAARRWYCGQAVRSAPPLVAATWWAAPGRRAGPVGRRAAAAVGGAVVLQVVHQTAQALTGWALVAAGLAANGPALPAASLLAGAGCAVLAGALAARVARAAPLAGALALATACAALAATGMLLNGGVTPLWYWGGLQLVVLPSAPPPAVCWAFGARRPRSSTRPAAPPSGCRRSYVPPAPPRPARPRAAGA
jgi:hypothetical protein